MQKQIAVIGAGPSGLACAKAIKEHDMQPTIFEAASDIGGVWRLEDGFTWPEMQTNISRWNNCFSDFPWPEDSDDFPNAAAVYDYFDSYADRFALKDNLLLDTPVTALRSVNDQWRVDTMRKDGLHHDAFDGVVDAGGIFAKRDTPFPLCKHAIHSADYRRSPDWRGKRVAVIGASFSGIEIAADLAEQGAEVLLFMTKPIWVLPRYMCKGGKMIPLDLVTNLRAPPAADPLTANLNKARFLDSTFGNPGDVDETLRVPIDNSPIYVAISDRFLEFVRSGAIKPINARVEKIMPTRLKADNDTIYKIDRIVAATGYRTDLSILSRPAQRLLQYDSSDRLVPFIADQAVRPPHLKNLFFAGKYRGPFPGVMELQGRWIAAMMAEGQPPATAADVADEAAIRKQHKRPQFPHGNYVGFSDKLARKIGVFPEKTGDPDIDKAIAEGPVTPAQWRLNGPHAVPGLAHASIRSALARAAP